MKNNIILIGFMGTGKTTIGKMLARRIGYDFIDTDDLIVNMAGISIPEIFSQFGERYFRQLEQQAIKLAFNRSGIVLATGGGAVMDPANFSFLKENGYVIALDATEDTLWERLKASKDRPMLFSDNPREKIRSLLEMRCPVYHKAHFIVSVDKKTPEQLVDEIVSILRLNLTTPLVEGGNGYTE